MKKTYLLMLLAMLLCIPAVRAEDEELTIAFRKSIAASVLTAPKKVNYTATTNKEADIKIYVNDVVIGEENAVKQLKSPFDIQELGDYVAYAEATADGVTVRSQNVYVSYTGESVEAADKTVPPFGLTKNSDDTYTFCFAAPEKNLVMLAGSWNDYMLNSQQKMEYVDEKVDGYDVRYFKITLPASVTGHEFGYYYMVDGSYNLADPWARLVLDPSNDKWINYTEVVYPNLPAYPSDLVPSGTMISWHSDDMLAYDWKCTDFKGAEKDNLVIYEMLFRDFTGTEGAAKGNGTVRKAIEKLDYIKSLGVNAVELLPINEFNGNNSWGYNPNLYFAVDKAYGTPQDYKEFIDLCHQNGIAVILDVVFNQAQDHPWYSMYKVGSNPFFNATAPHAYSVLNDWNQGYPLVQTQWKEMLKFWLTEYKVDGFRFDLVKGLGDNDSYKNASESVTNAYNASRVARMKELHNAMREVNPDAYFINEDLAGAKEENEMAEDGELNWANVNNSGCQFAMAWSDDSSLNRMWAKKDSRTIGSTVAYLESHDEQRLAYKQDMWGNTGVKGDVKVSMQRLGSAAAQMIMVPGSHMIWMFSEMGNAQNTKNADGGNNTSPKIVNWSLLDEPNHAALKDCYSELIALRLSNPDVFSSYGNYAMSFSGWKGRTASCTTGTKEFYLVVNPSVTETLTQKVNFLLDDNSAYKVASKSYESNPVFDAAAKTVVVEPNCYAVITTTTMGVGVESVNADEMDRVAIAPVEGGVCVLNPNAAVNVYTLDGICVASRKYAEMAENHIIQLPAGLYVVRCGNHSAKVVVK